MARVFERPRYKDQARNKLLALATACDTPELQHEVCVRLGVPSLASVVEEVDFTWLASQALDGDEVDAALPDVDANLEAYLLDSEIGRLVRDPKLMRVEAVAKTVSSFIATSKHWAPKVVYTDEHALFYLLHAAMSDRTSHVESVESRTARSVAMLNLERQALGQKVAPAAIRGAIAPFAKSYTPAAARADDWLGFAEELQYKAQPMFIKYCRLWTSPPRKIKQHLMAMLEKIDSLPDHERFLVRRGDGIREGWHTYNYNGVIVIYTGSEGDCLIVDNSLADYLRTCMTSLRNSAVAFKVYRMTADPSPAEMYTPYLTCLAWITNAIRDVTKAREVARHMHLAYTRWQNAIGESEARVDCGHLERDPFLESDMLAYHPRNSSWWDLVTSFAIPERSKAELFKLYHLLPPADIDPLLLHNELASKVGVTNECSIPAIKEFIDFCAAYDLARYISKNHNSREPKMKVADGYKLEDQKWFKRCKEGHLVLPPKKDRGKARLSRVWAYDRSGDFHIFSAKDATRVIADLDAYMARSQSRSMDPDDNNELLSAIFKGPLLSNGDTMSEWRDRVYKREIRDTDHIIAAEAGKAENTKCGVKVRETLSGSDIAREFLTEVDQSLRPLAAQTPGVSLRADAVKHKRKFQIIAQGMSTSSQRTAFATSTDVSGWSPNMPRAMFHAWQDYALSTTECPDPTAVRQIWDRLKIFVDRRGTKASADCFEGNIQGWPATSDTTMHAHILIYWAYMLRDEQILSAKEAAYTLCLIDDAATQVVLEGNAAECKRKADRAKELLASTYRSLGFEMDQVKSFFSTIKFVYLNELYVDGAQVAHATKTLMRIDRDHSRRFAALPDQISATMGVAASAANQGADPLLAYLMGSWSSIRLAYSVVPELRSVPLEGQAVIASTPAGMNGLGIRPVTAVMATGAQDQLAWFLEVLDPWVRSTPEVSGFCGSLIKQDPAEATPIGVFKSPMAYSVATHISAASAVAREFRKAARVKGMAEPFKSLDLVEDDPAYEKAIRSVLLAGAHEASLLEELSGSMPDSFVDETMARVDKSELIAALLGSRGIASLRKRVREADVHNLRIAVGLWYGRSLHDTSVMPDIANRGAYTVAREMRDRHLGEYKVLNHTYPCPFSMWAFQGVLQPGSHRADRLTTVTFTPSRLRRTVGSSSVNLYDSAMYHIGYKGYRSAQTTVQQEVRVAVTNPVRRKVATGLAALRWAKEMGCHYINLATLFCQAWGDHDDITLMDLPGRLVVGSAKRMSLRHTKSNHLVLMFPNTQAAFAIDARAITRAHAAYHTMHDMMGAITSLRASMMIEAGIRPSKQLEGYIYGFAYKPNAAAVMQVPDLPEAEVSLELLQAVRSFVSIESPLKNAAIVATTPSAMSEILGVYDAISARAAEDLWDHMTKDLEIDDEVGTELRTNRVQINRLESRPQDVRRSFTYSSVFTKPSTSGAVEAERGSRQSAEPITIQVAALSSAEAIRTVANGLADSTAIDLCIEAPDFAWAIVEACAEHQPLAVVDHEDWDRHRPRFEWGLAKCKAFASAVQEAIRGSGKALGPSVCDTFLALGAAGMRVDDEHDYDIVVHCINSFTGRTSTIIALLQAVSRSIKKFRGKFSEARVAGAKNITGTVVRIIKAQWNLAGARYHAKANAFAEAWKDDPRITSNNYRSIFARAASVQLKSDGFVSERQLYSEFASRLASSIIHHAGELADEAGEFIAETKIGHIDSRDYASEWDEILTIYAQASADPEIPFLQDFDRNAVKSAAEEIHGWVKADIKGDYEEAPKQSRYAKFKKTTAPAEPYTSASDTGPSRTSRDSSQARQYTPRPGALMLAPGEEFEMPTKAEIGAVDEEEEAQPHEVWEWYIDNAGADMDPDELDDTHARISKSRAAYDEWRQATDLTDYTQPSICITNPFSFDEDNDDDEYHAVHT